MKNKIKYTLKELPAQERPREKLRETGRGKLANIELLALLLGSGGKDRTALELSQDLIYHIGGIKNLEDVTVQELEELSGIGLAKACRVLAAVELGRRIQSESKDEDLSFSSPARVASYLIPRLQHLSQEICQLLLLNAQHKLITSQEVSRGSLTRSILHPREVFKPAIKTSSAGIILAHNHPSGDINPSSDDIELTNKLVEAGELIGIPLLDHIIIGGNDFFSMRERDLIGKQ